MSTPQPLPLPTPDQVLALFLVTLPPLTLLALIGGLGYGAGEAIAGEAVKDLIPIPRLPR